jgi:cell division protease FtsH
MTQMTKTILAFVGALVLVGAVLSLVNLDTTQKTDIMTVARGIQDGQIASITIEGSNVEAIQKDGKKLQTSKETSESCSEVRRNYNVDPEKTRAVKIEVKEQGGMGYWMGIILPNVLPFVLMIGIVWFLFRQVQGQNNKAMMFGQSGAIQRRQG